MEASAFSEISIIIAIATIVAIIMRLLRQPLIIGHILTGIIVGPAVLDIIHGGETIGAFASIGIALLLFIIGIGLNPRVVREVGKVAFLAGSIQVAATTSIGYVVMKLLGYTNTPAALVALATAFSSTIIVLKLISDKKEQTRLYAKISIGMLLVQDIIATLALLVLATSSDGVQGADLAMLLVRGVLIFAALWLTSTYVLPRIQKLLTSNQELLFLFALGWGFGIATLFEATGFSIEVGALFAGIGLASQTYAQEISARLRPLRDFFIVVFFIVLGTELIVTDLLSILWPSLLLSAMVLITNPLVIFSTLGIMGYTRNTSFKTAIGMAQISEFSLVFAILANREGLLPDELLSILTLVALITIAVSTYMILYADGMFRFMQNHFALFEHRKVNYDQQQADHYPIVMFGYKKGGAEFIKTFKNMRKKFAVIDYDPDVIDHLEHSGVHYMYGDANDIELLDEVGIEQAKLVISTITDHATNKFLVTHVHSINPKAVIICHSDSAAEAQELYDHGATYVMMAHAIGSERISSFIKRNGFNKTEFKRYREIHQQRLATKMAEATLE